MHQTSQAFYSIKPMSHSTNTIQKNTHIATSNKTMQIHVYQFILYSNLVILIPPQNIIKMFTHISGVENTALSKGDMGIFKLTSSL